MPQKKLKNLKKEVHQLHNNTDYYKDDTELIRFDYNYRYGPSRGITRLKRWERAQKYNLNPPEEIKTKILKYNLNKSILDKFI
jgi:hypothetical protein